MPAPRRSQEERTRLTRAALTDAARTLFAERGYANVPADDIVRAAGVTRGALYHHYTDKQGLFREVFEQLEAELMAEIEEATQGAPDVPTIIAAALARYLDICERPEVQRIALIDAPAVLGWPAWREVESRHALGMITELLQSGVDAGTLPPTAVPALAQLVLSAVIEAALMITHATDREAARAQAQQALLLLFASLLRTD